MELNFNVRETDIEKVRISPFQTKTIYHLASDHFRHNVLRKPTADVLGVLPLTLSASPPTPGPPIISTIGTCFSLSGAFSKATYGSQVQQMNTPGWPQSMNDRG